MTEHSNAAIARRAMDALKAGDMTELEAVLDDHVIWHEIGSGEPILGRAAVVARMSGGNEPVTFGDARVTFEVHDIVANDDHAIVLVNASATRSGRTLDYRTAETLHFRDGRITERWALSNETAAIPAFFA